ncbi:MAG: aspartate--tRNA ligase [Acidobacteriaceae bacterium]
MSNLQLDFLGSTARTHYCGALRASDAGQQAVLMGWVNRRRDLGNLIFIDVRDRSGITQVVFDAGEANTAVLEKAAELRAEYVIAVTGLVKRRDPKTVNPKMETGEIELAAQELLILNDSKPLPFNIADGETAGKTDEEVRLRYRYLDLRRPEMQANIELRHKVALAIRQELNARGFMEIETPFMTRSTPEGARDYLVPSRVHPGSFYALPQSPQIFKQILMISGCDKYFQIVRCFRDEDLRADRQPEFTQIDLEMSFPTQEKVFAVVESFLSAAFAVTGAELTLPFPRMTYDEAMRKYGSDKPDLRVPALTDVSDLLSFEQKQALNISAELPVIAIRAAQIGELSRKERDEIKTLLSSKAAKAVKLIDDFKRLDKSFPDAAQTIRIASEAQEGDLILLLAAPGPDEDLGRLIPGVRLQREYAVYQAAGDLRLALARKYAARHHAFDRTGSAADYHFLWVTDFPMFEYDEEEHQWNAAHHPFTSPHEDDLKAGRLTSDPGAVRALAYDIVLNGTELGSGSIRIHRQDVQAQIFRALGMSDEEAHSRFGFFLEALEYGTPPHGGIALGLDRIVMILAGAPSLREVIPFPKTARAVDLMMDAPTPVSEAQLRELAIRVSNPVSGA